VSELKSFEELGRGYQEKVVQALFEDPQYAEMMTDVFEPDYFTYAHLKGLARIFFEYKTRYREFPSAEVAIMQLQQEDGDDLAMLTMAVDFVKRMLTTPLNGDRAWIQESSLEFCRRQKLIAALGKALEQVENKRYDSIAGTIRSALELGSSRDHGHDYAEEVDARAEKSIREPIPTGWPVLDKYLGGGWERKTITTFIAPTGAGKSMALVNCAAALVEQGYNVLYVTLEMADYKIGLRADSWFTGMSIDDSSKKENRDKVKDTLRERAKGRLIIKEWPTKRANVETIRGHIQRLKTTKNFKPDAIIIDYPDLLKAGRSYGEKRHELEGNYEELRGLAQEENAVMIVADQTNRGGLDLELVTISAIAEAYSKATVCDLIITISRTPQDKQEGGGRFFIAKSRLGSDGIVLPFLLKTSANIRITVLDTNEDPISLLMKTSGEEGMKKFLKERLDTFGKKAPERMSEISRAASAIEEKKKTGTDED
jgi:archaellum biogenesis ATPase FlaH